MVKGDSISIVYAFLYQLYHEICIILGYILSKYTYVAGEVYKISNYASYNILELSNHRPWKKV